MKQCFLLPISLAKFALFIELPIIVRDEIYIYIYIYIYIQLVTVVEGDLKVPFSMATTPRCSGGRYPIFWIAPLYS